MKCQSCCLENVCQTLDNTIYKGEKGTAEGGKKLERIQGRYLFYFKILFSCADTPQTMEGLADWL
jgi:hypothetical protein